MAMVLYFLNKCSISPGYWVKAGISFKGNSELGNPGGMFLPAMSPSVTVSAIEQRVELVTRLFPASILMKIHVLLKSWETSTLSSEVKSSFAWHKTMEKSQRLFCYRCRVTHLRSLGTYDMVKKLIRHFFLSIWKYSITQINF